MQAADGSLWVGTAEGLVRFDGVRFIGFSRAEEAALSRLPMRMLYALPQGDVWAATSRGGLLRWDQRRLTMVWKDADPSVPTNQIVPVSQVADAGMGRRWIVRGDEVWLADRAAAPVRVERTPEIEAALHADAERWARRGRGTGAAVGPGPALIDRAGRRWSSSGGEGLSVTGPDGDAQQVLLPRGEPSVRVADLHEDREGNIWVATGGSGLAQVRESRVAALSTADGLSDHSALAVMEDHTGALWIGMKSGGVDRLANGRIEHMAIGDSTRPVSALCEDRDGVIWAATRGGIVFRQQDGAFKSAFPKQAAPAKVFAMVQDRTGRLWFGGQQGLASWAEGQVTLYGGERALEGADISALALDGRDALWIGTTGGAVIRGSSGRFETIAGPEALSHRMVSALLPEADGAVWIATLGSGLFRWKEWRLTRYSEEEGLPDPRLTCVLADDSDCIWLGSLGGIFRARKEDLARKADGGPGTVPWLQLDRSDGMLSRECAGYFQPAGCRTRDGRLWFPTIRGVANLHPARLRLNPAPAPAAVMECRANGRALNMDAPLRVGPGRPRLEFRYTAFSFTAPGRVKFRTRMEGLDSEWREVGSQRAAAFEAVPPGKYRFEVQAANGDGVWSASGASIAVEVLPHVWETPWFQAAAAALAAAAAVGAGWAIARARMRRRLARLQLQRARELERVRIAQDLHDDLGASLTEISLLAQLAAEEPADGPGGLREPLPEIASKAKALVGALDEIVWAVNPRYDTLASLADYLAAFAAEFLEAAGITLRLDIPRGLPGLPLDAERRHSLFLAAREALNNAVKHSRASEITLQLRADADRVAIVIADNGRGFDPERTPHGDGTANIPSRLAKLGGESAIESVVGAGVTVRLSVPLRDS